MQAYVEPSLLISGKRNMSIDDATYGRASNWWKAGQERRFNMVRRHIMLDHKRILDIGCGIGMYLRAFQRHSQKVFGIEVEEERAQKALSVTLNISMAYGESLPFPDSSFDVVFLHEVIEHVFDDRLTISEAYRVTRNGGNIVIFAPNRLYPFETHGIFWQRQYHFGNVPLVGYLPDALRNYLVPHARAYTASDLRRLFDGLPVEFVVFTQVFPGFDKLMTRSSRSATTARRLFYGLESTPLRVFGLSHFVVARIEKL